MEWYTLEPTMKKNLLFIMRRSTVPIEFTSSYIILMNLDSFVGVSTKCLLLHDVQLNSMKSHLYSTRIKIFKTSFSNDQSYELPSRNGSFIYVN